MNPDGGEAAHPGHTKRYVRIAIASVVLIIGFVWVLRSGSLPLLPPAGTLSTLKILPFIGFLACMVAHLLIRYGRCYFLIAPIAKVPLRRIMTINGMAMALITFMPFRLGELARPVMLRERGKISAWAVTATVGAERIVDGLLFSAMLLFGLFLAEPASPLPERVGDLPISAAIVPRAGMLASIGFGAVFVVMVIFYRFRKFSIRVTEKVFGLVSPKLGARIAELVGRVSDGLRFLADARTAVPYTVITIGCLVAHVWGVQLLAYAVGLDEVTFAQAMVMVGMLALGFATPNAPGGFGAVQLALYAALAVYVAPARVVHQGGALVFLFHASYLALIVIIALLSLLAETRTAQSSMQPSAP
jgi:hypothetical protein